MTRLVSSLLFAFYYFQVSAQYVAIPFAHGNHKYSITYQKHEGHVQLTGGSKIQGTFEYGADEFPTYNLKQFSVNNEVEKRYKSKEIKSVVLAGSDSILSNKDSTYFFVFNGSPNFWRQLSFDKDVQVFDWLFTVTERPGLIYRYIVVRKDDKFYDCLTPKDFIDWMRKNAPGKIKWSDKITVQDIIRQLNGLT